MGCGYAARDRVFSWELCLALVLACGWSSSRSSLPRSSRSVPNQASSELSRCWAAGGVLGTRLALQSTQALGPLLGNLCGSDLLLSEGRPQPIGRGELPVSALLQVLPAAFAAVVLGGPGPCKTRGGCWRKRYKNDLNPSATQHSFKPRHRFLNSRRPLKEEAL